MVGSAARFDVSFGTIFHIYVQIEHVRLLSSVKETECSLFWK